LLADLNLDRIANVIHRGRDHGLPTYAQVRRSCGISPANTFADLNNTVSARVINLLSRTYDHVEDIDLFVGGLAERPLSGAVIGPTFGCLLGQQFEILKKGDRFWYENNIPPSALNKGKRAANGEEAGGGRRCKEMEWHSGGWVGGIAAAAALVGRCKCLCTAPYIRGAIRQYLFAASN
jgi:hypothetical protein